ncbi:unnamed protein product, partial [Laminaria digitata]
MTWRRLITRGAMRQWRPRVREANREVRQFGVTVLGGVEYMGLRAQTLHEMGNRLVITDCSNAFNTAIKTAALADVANCVPGLTIMVKCFNVQDQQKCLHKMDSRTIACSSRVQQGDPMGPETFCLALQP